jgi:hypothetical protein
MRTLLPLLLSALAFGSSALAHPVETPNGPATIREVREDLMSWKGKLVAFRVRVLEVHTESKGQPALKVAVGVGAETESFWIGSLVTKKFSPGNDVLVLGLMTGRPKRAMGLKLSELSEDLFVVLGICFVNLTEDWGAGTEDSRPLCDEWFKRRMPDTPPDP